MSAYIRLKCGLYSFSAHCCASSDVSVGMAAARHDAASSRRLASFLLARMVSFLKKSVPGSRVSSVMVISLRSLRRLVVIGRAESQA